MDIDLSQFSQVFFEESIEGLAAMEAELLNLDVDNPDDDSVLCIQGTMPMDWPGRKLRS